MAGKNGTLGTTTGKGLLASDTDLTCTLVQATLQEVLEGEMSEQLRAAKSERTSGRAGYRSGYCSRTSMTRVGKLELQVPQDREGRFSTELVACPPARARWDRGERDQRSEKALVAATGSEPEGRLLAEMYVQGVSTRKVKAITEELCGHRVSASMARSTSG